MARLPDWPMREGGCLSRECLGGATGSMMAGLQEHSKTGADFLSRETCGRRVKSRLAGLQECPTLMAVCLHVSAQTHRHTD